MGALTSNRKRGDDYYNSIPKSPSFCAPDIDLRVDTRISKKPKFSPSMHTSPDRSCLLKNVASRISLYPKPIPLARRDVHAPCRPTKFGFSTSSRLNTSQREGSADVIGDFLGNRYEEAKIRAFDTFRYWNLKKDKDVIDVEAETVKDEVSEDSRMEEVAVVDDKREGRSLDSDQRSRETNEILETFKELDAKAAERNFQPSSSSLVSNLTNANLKLDSEGDLRYQNRELDVLDLDVPLHKRLLDSAERRNDKLSSLHFQIELHESSIATLKLYRPAKKPEDLAKEAFVPLTKGEEAEVAVALSRPKRRLILVAHENSNIEVTGEILQCLRPRAWLNDEVINLYFELLKEREKREPQKFLKCHFFNTFFYKKLISGRSGYDFKSVKRWTTQRKLGYGLIECDKIFVPIHKEVHWCLAVINKKDEKFQYLDSLRGVDKQVMKVLARYFVDEVKDKSGIDIDVSSWKQEYVEDLPDQENGFDCGMFMIKYADFYSRDVGLCFNQEHMPYFRLRTVKEILRLKAE